MLVDIDKNPLDILASPGGSQVEKHGGMAVKGLSGIE